MRKVLIAVVCVLLAACGPRDTRPDSEKLAEFRVKVSAIDQRVTAASDTYTKTSNAALDRGDHAALDTAAVALHAALAAIRPDAAALKVPEFTNPNASEHAGRVLAALVAGIDANRDAAIAISRIRDSHNPTQAELSAIQAAKERVSTASLTESDAMFSLFTDLGAMPGPPR